MRQDLALKLKEKAEEIAKNFSNLEREFNYSRETFEIHKLVPLSEVTAALFLRKSSGKLALVFLYWINAKGGYWAYFFPTDSHVLGLKRLDSLLQEIEEHNFSFNFSRAVLSEFA